MNKKQFKTFDEWNKIGRRIKKGSKAKKVNGINYFHIDQTYDPFEDLNDIRCVIDIDTTRGFI